MSLITQVNGQELTPRQHELRAKMLERMLDKLTNHTCCRTGPDWRNRIHQLNYAQLCGYYLRMFGKRIE